jgi:hypothetical protein
MKNKIKDLGLTIFAIVLVIIFVGVVSLGIFLLGFGFGYILQFCFIKIIGFKAILILETLPYLTGMLLTCWVWIEIILKS